MNSQLLFLLQCFAAGAHASPERVHAFVGLPAVLPCRHDPSDDLPTIEWSKPDLKPFPYVFIYRDDYEMHAEKHRDFLYRTHLFMNELHKGNFAMRLSDVRESDAGEYLCRTIWRNRTQNEKTVELSVERVPRPQISVIRIGNGTVTLSCSVGTCLQTAPRLTLRDEAGGELKPEGVEEPTQTGDGCHVLQQRVSTPVTAKSVVCRAEFTEISQSTEERIVIPAGGEKESCARPELVIVAGVAGALSALMMSLGAGLLFAKCRESAQKNPVVRQGTGDTTTSAESERQLLLSSSVAVDIPGADPDPDPAEPAPLGNSATSGADGGSGRRISLFIDGDTKPASCDMSEASETIRFTNKKGDKRGNLTRQDATSAGSVGAGLSNDPPQPTRRGRVWRSRSVSEACPPKPQWRRYSVTMQSAMFKPLEEDPELETLYPDTLNPEIPEPGHPEPGHPEPGHPVPGHPEPGDP